MPTYSTGIVTNTRDFGTAASNIVVSTRNLNLQSPVTVMIEIYASVDSSVFYTGYLTSYVVAADSFDVREFFIAGNVAFEVQVDLSLSDALLTVTGINEFGNLVEDQIFTIPELNIISGLSPAVI
ncbi:hypothetical protein [Paenibacillus sp. CF384]|uniref:hypothetical protein n=1 Tax=Paenibacillus sp. CF384 TaxID=1884382 RepID=UPI0008981C73|nr:hypothetical protein [Paenibacillus sp. CF384]SDX49957.1 hypothetical protein SAMN05518855_101557 [Paenibacillus sp. CF384]